jgi:hypothetical protein
MSAPPQTGDRWGGVIFELALYAGLNGFSKSWEISLLYEVDSS